MISPLLISKTGVAFGLLVIVLGLLFGPFHLFPSLPFAFGISSLGVLAISLIAFALSRFEGKREFSVVFGEAAIAILSMYFLSNLATRSSGFAQVSFPVFAWVAVSALIYIVFRAKKLYFLWATAILTSLAALFGFFYYSGSALIFSDDHPSFLYRLAQLKENFPNIPFYNPLWNGGVEAREFFASGILNIFTVFSPIIYFFDLTSSYTYIVVSLLFVIVPSIAFLTAKVVRLESGACAILVVLSTTFSLLWYRWSLSYGTLGFVFSTALVSLNLALFARFLAANGNVSVFSALGTAISFTLMLLWSPSAILFSPLLLLVVPRLFKLAKQKMAWVTLAALLLLNVPWMGAFMKFSNVADFVAVSQNPDSNALKEEAHLEAPVHDLSKFRMIDQKKIGIPWWRQTITRIRDNFTPISPIVLFFGLPGLFLIRGPTNRKVYGLACLSALIFGILGPGIKPQLELERMIVILGLILALPASILINEFINKHSNPVLSSALVGLLAFSPIWIFRITSNLTTEKYATASPIVQELISAIKLNAGEGRTLFAGFTLHELSHGHVAPLAYWTGLPLIASSYQHDRWRYVDVIPEEYRSRKQAGVIQYLDLMNVTSVVTHDRFWRKWFSSRPELFERVWQGGVFQLFRRRNYNPNYFLEGLGKIDLQQGNKVDLMPESKDIVVKFKYLPFLKASNCNLQPLRISESITFIKLANCELGKTVRIEAEGMSARLF